MGIMGPDPGVHRAMHPLGLLAVITSGLVPPHPVSLFLPMCLSHLSASLPRTLVIVTRANPGNPSHL